MAGLQPMLALEGTAHGQGVGWRKGEDLIDALPYIDALTPAAKRTVEEMIEVEMGNSTKKPSDYLREMAPVLPSRLEEGGMLAMELER
jgi:pre-mRNA-splicing factor SPF27